MCVFNTPLYVVNTQVHPAISDLAKLLLNRYIILYQ